MFLPCRVSEERLQRKNVEKFYLVYSDLRRKIPNGKEKCWFLREFEDKDNIPRFWKFRVPSKGCFDETIVHNLQRRHLREQFSLASKSMEGREAGFEIARDNIGRGVDENLLPSIVLYC